MNTTLTIRKTVVRKGVYTYPTYRLRGFAGGERVRKQFASEAEAKGEKLRLEIEAANAMTQVKPVITRLNLQQVADAEAAMLRLNGKPLSEAVDWYLATYTAPLNEMDPAGALKAFLADRKPHITPSAYEDYERDISAFLKTQRGKSLIQMTTEAIVAYLDSRKFGSKKSWNNMRGQIGAFFEFCKKYPRRWVKENPVEPIPTFKIPRGLPEVLTVEGAEALMRYVETYAGTRPVSRPGCLVTYFALALFAGIRPSYVDGELAKLNDPAMFAKAVNLNLGVIRILPEVSKTKDLRQITIRPNLRAWLEAYPFETYPILFPGFQACILHVRQKFQLPHDVLRHTFISMHVAKYQNLGKAALEAGNSESIIRKHYLNLVEPGAEEKFWEIRPTK